MSSPKHDVAESEKKTFFISRAGPDRRWAELIANVVRDAGHEAIHQDEHFTEGTSFSHNMMLAAESDCTIPVLSPSYFESEPCLAELHAALGSDPLGVHGRIIPVLVASCEIPRLLGHLAYVNFLGIDDDTARQRLMVALHKHGKLDVSKLALRSRTRRAIEQANRDRSDMIAKVRAIWITGILEHSLFHEIRILLGLAERPSAVASPFDLLVKRPDEGDQPFPSGTRVLDIYKQSGKSLLILGTPGSGKTTLLLELARDLLDSADHDSSHPIPVVFPLSTWAASRKPLVEWLGDELNLRYFVKPELANEWIDSENVLPLLDGLDEMKAEHRVACIGAINEFRKSHGSLPLVVTSRTTDYQTLAEPLWLHRAIVVENLTRDQVNSYLGDLGPDGELVRAAIREDVSLWELLDSPLLLNVLTRASAGQGEAPAVAGGSAGERRDRLFKLYVDKMFTRGADQRHYARRQAIHWLGWLAHQMEVHVQTVYYIERTQPEWLLERVNGHEFKYFVNLFVLAVSLFVGLLSGLVLGLFSGLVSGLLSGLLSVLLALRSSKVIFSLPRVFDFEPTIQCVERMRWSWVDFRTGLGRGLAHRANGRLPWQSFILLVGGLCIWLVRNRYRWMVGATVVCAASVVYELVFPALVLGLSTRRSKTSTVPNQGIHQSARNAVVCGLGIGLCVALVIGLAAWVVAGLMMALKYRSVPWDHWKMVGLMFALPIGLVVGLNVGLVFGLLFGGKACLLHLALRLCLVRNDLATWRYARFLDYAADRILLRKVGGGYMFIHRMLLEYFAARYVEASSGGAKSAKASSVGDEL
jgi:hypothetical protein